MKTLNQGQATTGLILRARTASDLIGVVSAVDVLRKLCRRKRRVAF